MGVLGHSRDEFIPWGSPSYEEFKEGLQLTALSMADTMKEGDLIFGEWTPFREGYARNWDWELYQGKSYSGRCECCGNPVYNTLPLQRVDEHVSRSNGYWPRYIAVNREGEVVREGEIAKKED